LPGELLHDESCRISGFSRQEAIGKTSLELGWISQEDTDRLGDLLARDGAIDELDLTLKTKDKDLIEAVYRGEIVRVNNNEVLLSIAHDITDRKKSEETLRASEELHRLTLENISDSIFITDDNGDFTYVCPNTQIIFGYSKYEIESFGNIDRILPSQGVELRDFMQSGEIKNIEMQIKDRNGHERYIIVNIKKVNIMSGALLSIVSRILNVLTRANSADC
jgi:PAS domain S-box-containing protein